VALANPRNGTIEMAGPGRAPFNEIVARYLKAVGDQREAVKAPKPDISAGDSRKTRSYPWPRRVSAASISRVATPLAERSRIRSRTASTKAGKKQ